ncbi:MAG: DUF5063 domain-containing protein [Coriobacteriia bacterium]|nr:DUF5063 domain-containing protein [Coriobacteriia bacterium]
MGSEADNAQAIEVFAATAGEFCDLLDGHSAFTLPEFIRVLDRALTKLLYHGSLLTWPELGRWQHPQSAVSLDAEMARRDALDAFIGPAGWYWSVFDPADPENHEAVPFSLGSDLAEIYTGLNFNRVRGAGGRIRPAVVWAWCFGFESDWGNHVVSALQVTHALIAWHDMAEDA